MKSPCVNTVTSHKSQIKSQVSAQLDMTSDVARMQNSNNHQKGEKGLMGRVVRYSEGERGLVAKVAGEAERRERGFTWALYAVRVRCLKKCPHMSLA